MQQKDIIDKELKNLERFRMMEYIKTESKKGQFIQKIKGELGKEIKSNPSGVKIHKKTWKEKVAIFFRKLFTKF